jgi:hypothetical protein
MRTTVALDPDVAALLESERRERGVTFTRALNDALRRGLRGQGGATATPPVFSQGKPAVPLDRALTLAGDLEDRKTARRLTRGR